MNELDKLRLLIDYEEGDAVVNTGGYFGQVKKIHRDHEGIPFEVEMEGEFNTAWEPISWKKVNHDR